MAEELIHITPEELYDKLLTDFNIKSVEGRITFCLGSVGIIVKQKDVVGNIIQEWLEGWLRANNIYFAPNPNTQMPPDIFLNEDRKVNLVEVKAFNSEGSAGFDLADFKSYVKEIIEKPYMLHVKYLIFAYKMDSNGIVTITDIWLRNIWEISAAMGKSANWTVKVQYKNKQIHKLRPTAWYSTKPSKTPVFETLEDFLGALEETIFKYTETRELANSGWKDKLIDAYSKQYNITLNIPRWMDIECKYRLESLPKGSNKKS